MDDAKVNALLESRPAPRVLPEQVEAAIKSETYTLLPNGRTTVCQLILQNDFSVEGQSACVSIDNYDEELGNHYARIEAVKAIWPLLAYELATRIKEGKAA